MRIRLAQAEFTASQACENVSAEGDMTEEQADAKPSGFLWFLHAGTVLPSRFPTYRPLGAR